MPFYNRVSQITFQRFNITDKKKTYLQRGWIPARPSSQKFNGGERKDPLLKV